MNKLKILAVIVNYGKDQLDYLKEMILSLNNFEKYHVKIIVHSNVDIDILGVHEVKIFQMDNYWYLPSTCRDTIWKNKENFDLFFYSENDMLIREIHFDNFLKYLKVLPNNRISGLLRYETDGVQNYYPDYHADFAWKKKSVEKHGNYVFAHFTNLHQACFIITKEQLKILGNKFEFYKLVKDRVPLRHRVKMKVSKIFRVNIKRYYIYDAMCKVGTDVYQYGGMKKLICISEFEDNLIHHMSDVYINGSRGRKKQHVDEKTMQEELKKLW